MPSQSRKRSPSRSKGCRALLTSVLSLLVFTPSGHRFAGFLHILLENKETILAGCTRPALYLLSRPQIRGGVLRAPEAWEWNKGAL